MASVDVAGIAVVVAAVGVEEPFDHQTAAAVVVAVAVAAVVEAVAGQRDRLPHRQSEKDSAESLRRPRSSSSWLKLS